MHVNYYYSRRQVLTLFILSLPYTRRKLGAAFRGVHRILYVAGMTDGPTSTLLDNALGHSAPSLHSQGSCFYLYLPGSYFHYNLLHSSPVMMLWNDAKQTVAGRTTDFHILAGRQSRHLHLLRTVEAGDRMLLDGPYGQDLRLHEYETVILTAKGMGIVSILPMALHLAARKNNDDSVRSQSNKTSDPTVALATSLNTAPVFHDSTRRIDLLWRLEHNDQELWVADQLKALQDLDPRQVMFLVWCIYPNARLRDPPFREEPHWSAIYPQGGQTMAEAEVPFSFEKALSHEVLLPGKCIVVDERRASVIRNTSRKWPIVFVEAEYRPGHVTQQTSHRSPVARRMRLTRRDRHPRGSSSYDDDDDIPLHVV
ncbi:hypothetical protein GE09DRAFT_1163722 [Coniochaeta sp. 2T2.1]|nr:hypothetical protein GE09DRAFT_1163722 [Coniochaeta sp. 2T2.1]